MQDTFWPRPGRQVPSLFRPGNEASKILTKMSVNFPTMMDEHTLGTDIHR